MGLAWLHTAIFYINKHATFIFDFRGNIGEALYFLMVLLFEMNDSTSSSSH